MQTDPNSFSSSPDMRVLVLASTSMNALLICRGLERAGIPATECATIPVLCQETEQGAGTAIVYEEALFPQAVLELAQCVQKQPSWSDFPIIVLTTSGATSADSRWAEEVRQPLGNVTLLERPIRPVTLVSAVRSALRARSRQYQIRDYLESQAKAARALFESEERYRSLVTASASVTWTANVEGQISGEMLGWEQRTGQTSEEYRGRGWLEAVHPEQRDQIERRWQEAVTKRTQFEAECWLHYADGSYRRTLMRAVPLLDADGTLREWVGMCRDIEQERRTEEALRNSEKLAIAGRLAASIAHEINNPLESVTNLLYLMNHSGSLEQVREYCQMAQNELARVTAIVTQTLRFYRQPTGPSSSNIAELLDSVVTLFEPRLRARGIRVRRKYRPVRPLVCHSGELRQVFANIVLNSIDAMSRGGELQLHVHETSDPSHPDQRGVRVAIADTGSGMPQEVLDRLFQPFFTTKGNTGTGLGLWVTAELLRKHQARIQIRTRTTPGRCGTVFRLFFEYTGQEADKGQIADGPSKTQAVVISL